jgi:hypothetical protein
MASFFRDIVVRNRGRSNDLVARRVASGRATIQQRVHDQVDQCNDVIQELGFGFRCQGKINERFHRSRCRRSSKLLLKTGRNRDDLRRSARRVLRNRVIAGGQGAKQKRIAHAKVG